MYKCGDGRCVVVDSLIKMARFGVRSIPEGLGESWECIVEVNKWRLYYED
jgi:hypothetical protein